MYGSAPVFVRCLRLLAGGAMELIYRNPAGFPHLGQNTRLPVLRFPVQPHEAHSTGSAFSLVPRASRFAAALSALNSARAIFTS